MSPNYLQLQQRYQNKQHETLAGCREIFDKAWSLCFGNSNIEIKNNNYEHETRFIKIGTVSILAHLDRDMNSSKSNNRYLRIYESISNISLILSETEINQNIKYCIVKDGLIERLLNFFEQCKTDIKKIKQLQRKIIIEVNNFHEKLEKGIIKI